jgi:hypothetical protein
MRNFIQGIAQGSPYDPNSVEGYSEVELGKIESLYDISIQGQLKTFLLEMGRCDGGLIGDDPIILYRSNMNVANFVLLQNGLREEIYDTGWQDISSQKPFNFAIESETLSYFVLTNSDEPNCVYFYDENKEKTGRTEWDLFSCLKNFTEYFGGNIYPIVAGDLLEI